MERGNPDEGDQGSVVRVCLPRRELWPAGYPQRRSLHRESGRTRSTPVTEKSMSKLSNVTRRTAMRVAIAGAAAVATGAARAPRQGAGAMERVEGIGGFFFRAKDPRKLAA